MSSLWVPLDYCYGWNDGGPAHQALLANVRDTAKPKVLYIAPDSGPWSRSGQKKKEGDKKKGDREKEWGFLELVHNGKPEASG